MTDAREQALRSLLEAVEGDDWDACDQWSLARLEDPELGLAAQSVACALERDRSRRTQSRDAGEGDGLISPQRTLFLGIARVWSLVPGDAAVRELGEGRDDVYGLLVEGAPRVALACSCQRAIVVATDASGARSARQQAQLFAVLGALAYVTRDNAEVGRRFGLEPGTLNHVDLRSGTAPLLASRWHVDRGAALAPWLAVDDAVSVRPAGGRLALAPTVVRLEQAARRMQRRVWLARELGRETPDVEEDEVDNLLDELELLEGWGWTPELEPLRPFTAALIERVRAGDEPAQLRALLEASLREDART